MSPQGGLRRAESRIGFLLVIPTLIAFCIVILYPLLRSIALAFYRYTLFTPEPIFTGLANFQRIAEDPRLLQSWLITLIFVICTTSLTFILGLTWAIIMHQPFRGRGLVRSVSLLPWVFPSTVTAFLWAWMFNGQYGVINAALLQLGAIDHPVVWLSTPGGANAAIIIAKTWLSIPLFMAFFLAGLQTLSQEQLDAARVDGAGNISLLRFVVFPHLRYTMILIAILGAIGNLQQFDVIYALTGGGPVRATTVLSVEVYRQAFQNWNTGLASAIGVLWLLTIAGPAFFYLRSIFKNTA